MMEKTCTKCGETKSLDLFYRKKTNRTSACKACLLQEIKERDLQKRPMETRPRFRSKSLLSQGLKHCGKCTEDKPLELFYRNKHSTDGRGSWCAKCLKEYGYLTKDQNREARRAYVKGYNAKPKNRAARKAYLEIWHRASPRSTLRASLKAVRKQKNLTENPITLDELCEMFAAQDGKCAISGLTMTWRQGKITPTSISLDRIDWTGGYTKNNVRLVCFAVNAFRGRMTDDEMFTMALAIISNMKRPKLRLVS